jgi:uncharacterized protein YggE
MNKSLLLALALAALSLSPVHAQNTPPPPQISLSGSAEVRVVPDEVVLNVAVETRAETLEPARLENDQKIAACLAFLKESKIREQCYKTDHISIEPKYNHRDSVSSSYVKPVAYVVRKNLEVRLSDVADFQKIITGLLTNGVNYVNGVDFRSTELRKYRDKARAMAMRAAREKAEALTTEAGAKLGKVYSINAHDNGGVFLNNWNGRNSYAQNINGIVSSGGSDDNGADSFAVGLISISASVNVSFLIE